MLDNCHALDSSLRRQRWLLNASSDRVQTADSQPSAFEKLVVAKVEVESVETASGSESRSRAAHGSYPATEMPLQSEWASNAFEGQLAFDTKGGALLCRACDAREPELGMSLGAEEALLAQVLVARGVSGVDARGLDRHLDGLG